MSVSVSVSASACAPIPPDRAVAGSRAPSHRATATSSRYDDDDNGKDDKDDDRGGGRVWVQRATAAVAAAASFPCGTEDQLHLGRGHASVMGRTAQASDDGRGQRDTASATAAAAAAAAPSSGTQHDELEPLGQRQRGAQLPAGAGADDLNADAADSAAAAAAEEPPASCLPALDRLWFCYSPVYQFRYYYMNDTVDPCRETARAFFTCCRARLRSPERARQLYAEEARRRQERQPPPEPVWRLK